MSHFHHLDTNIVKYIDQVNGFLLCLRIMKHYGAHQVQA